MGPRVPFAPSFLRLRIKCYCCAWLFFFWKSNPIKLFKKKIPSNGVLENLGQRFTWSIFYTLGSDLSTG